jgi:hypothetical protein
MKMARKLPKSKSLDRKIGSQSPKWKIIIICEGEKTEPVYFLDFARHFKSNIVSVRLIPKGGPVRELVGRVKELQEEMMQKAQRSKNSFDQFFKVWGVPDVDEHPKLLEAMNLAQEHNLNIALSNPCFEIWGLLHFSEQNAPLHRKDAQRNLTTYMTSYSHSKNPIFDFELLKTRYMDAVTNAKRGLANRTSEGCIAGNPSTNVYLLMEEIRSGPEELKGPASK